MSEWLELVIVGFIFLSIGWVVWKGGAANPEGTRSLGTKVSHLTGKVTQLTTRVGHVESEVEELKREAATTKDIERLEQLGERTFRSIERLERLILEKGLK